MVDAEEFVKLQQSKPSEIGFKLATVSELFESGTAKITFYGESAVSEKEYSYLANYTPTKDDTVLVVPFIDTYIIAGKILFGEVAPPVANDFVTQADLDAYAKTTDLEPYATDAELANYAKTTALTPFYKNNSNATLNELTINGMLNHEGSRLCFFGSSLLYGKQSVYTISTPGTLASLTTGLNNVITALNRYNLI